MQLGAHKAPASESLSKMAAEWAEEAEAEGETSRGQTWAGDDLMDVHADQDDWSMSSLFLWFFALIKLPNQARLRALLLHLL